MVQRDATDPIEEVRAAVKTSVAMHPLQHKVVVGDGGILVVLLGGHYGTLPRLHGRKVLVPCPLFHGEHEAHVIVVCHLPNFRFIEGFPINEVVAVLRVGLNVSCLLLVAVGFVDPLEDAAVVSSAGEEEFIIGREADVGDPSCVSHEGNEVLIVVDGGIPVYSDSSKVISRGEKFPRGRTAAGGDLAAIVVRSPSPLGGKPQDTGLSFPLGISLVSRRLLLASFNVPEEDLSYITI
mmetsp:Transcript_16953/g.34900  ORF Transcript_16953/g.34900 Transcript_16953/m.34900 type:complete len:237 (+) Transcript_16953:3834-4544(+)